MHFCFSASRLHGVPIVDGAKYELSTVLQEIHDRPTFPEDCRWDVDKALVARSWGWMGSWGVEMPDEVVGDPLETLGCWVAALAEESGVGWGQANFWGIATPEGFMSGSWGQADCRGVATPEGFVAGSWRAMGLWGAEMPEGVVEPSEGLGCWVAAPTTKALGVKFCGWAGCRGVATPEGFVSGSWRATGYWGVEGPEGRKKLRAFGRVGLLSCSTN